MRKPGVYKKIQRSKSLQILPVIFKLRENYNFLNDRFLTFKDIEGY